MGTKEATRAIDLKPALGRACFQEDQVCSGDAVVVVEKFPGLGRDFLDAEADCFGEALVLAPQGGGVEV